MSICEREDGARKESPCAFKSRSLATRFGVQGGNFFLFYRFETNILMASSSRVCDYIGFNTQ